MVPLDPALKGGIDGALAGQTHSKTIEPFLEDGRAPPVKGVS